MRRINTLASILVLLAFGICQADDSVSFQKDLLPLFEKHCFKCHGEKKGLGKLRLHTQAEIEKKWKADDHLIVKGKPDESELFERLVLPKGNKKRMPKGGDGLNEKEIDIVRKWIAQGAMFTAAVATPQVEEKKEDVLPEVAAASEEAIEKLQAAGARVLPLFQGSNLLQVSYNFRDEPAGDAELALIAPVAEQIHTLELADSKATKDGYAPIAKCKNLRRLQLQKSAISDEGLDHLAGLGSLTYLNLYATGVTDAGLKKLMGLGNLKNIYLWQTKASYELAQDMQKKIGGLRADLGFDHPVVKKMRLTKEKAQLDEQMKQAKKEEEAAKKSYDTAKNRTKSLQDRLNEIGKSLKEVEGGEKDEEKAGEGKTEEKK